MIEEGYQLTWNDPDKAPTLTGPNGESLFVWCKKKTPYVSGITYPEVNAAAFVIARSAFPNVEAQSEGGESGPGPAPDELMQRSEAELPGIPDPFPLMKVKICMLKEKYDQEK